MRTPIIITLNQAKKDPKKLTKLKAMPAVYIYSDEMCHQAYWRVGCSGYTNRIGGNIGIFTGEEAYNKTRHNGEAKFIEFEECMNGGMIGTVVNANIVKPAVLPKAYRMRHIPSGLYYKPSIHGSKCNLSKNGKAYIRKPNLKQMGGAIRHPEDAPPNKYKIGRWSSIPIIESEWTIEEV